MKSKFVEKDGEKVPRSERIPGHLYTRDDCTMFFKHLVHNRMAGRCQKKYKDLDTIEEDGCCAKPSCSTTVSKPKETSESENKSTSKKKKFKVVPHGHQGFFDDDEE